MKENIVLYSTVANSSGNGFDYDAAIMRYIECGNKSYDVSSPPAGPPCIAAFWIYTFVAVLSLSNKKTL